MTKYVPKFLLKNLSKIYRKFSLEEFHFQDAVEILGIKEGYAGQVLSRLVDAGWIAKKRDPLDTRKKSYRIINVTLDDLMRDIDEEDE